MKIMFNVHDITYKLLFEVTDCDCGIKSKNFKITDTMWQVKLYQNYPKGLKISFFKYLRSLMMIINVKL